MRPGLRLQKRLLVVLLVLTGGAIINVSVAWGICIASPWLEWTPRIDKTQCGWCFLQAGKSCWKGELLRRRGMIRVSVHTPPSCGNGNDYQLALTSDEWRACIPSWFSVNDHQRVCSVLCNQPEGPHVWQWEETAAGWPMMSVHSSTLLDFDFVAMKKAGWNSDFVYRYRESRGLLVVPINIPIPNAENRLPWAPVLPGFAINTGFYAAIFWLLCAAPFAMRRRMRARSGECPACGYLIGTSNVCTECGWPVKAKSTDPTPSTMA